MPDKPAAEVLIDQSLVRRLLIAQAHDVPGAATLPLTYVADGWDCSVWRLGEHHAVRVPRRAVAAPLVVGEHRHLPGLAARLAPHGVGAPVPVVKGAPGEGYPWHWSVVSWFDGEPGMRVPRATRGGWADRLAAALLALHVPAVGGYPPNPFRGVPLVDRAEHVAERLAALRRAGTISPDRIAVLARCWADALSAPPWDGPPLWIHGDLHPGNVIARGDALVALIDFGDVTAGDPAYDLAIAWLAFDAARRDAFRAATSGRYDEATWTRARGWAAAETLIFLLQTDDDPTSAAFGVEVLSGLTDRSTRREARR